MSQRDISFWVRLRSSVILMIVAIASLVIGGPVLFTVLVIISLIGQMELYRVYKMNKSPLAIVGYASTLLYYGLLRMDKESLILPGLIVSLLVLMAVYVFSFPKYNSNQVAITYFGLFYVAIMLSFIYRVRLLDGGAYLVWLTFIGAWGSDTCAYLVGRKFGKHKLAPVLSPKKSIEGCFGGIFGAALIGFLFAMVFKNNISGVTYPQVAFAIIGGCSSVISQIGDLAASAIKRNHDVKDYGNLIPGHGGILDRFDSIIFTAPIVYYLAQLLIV